MEPTLPRARREILCRLLEAYERSLHFGKPAPWRRECILRLEARQFPAAFAPDGREELSALRAAAEELERAGAVRLGRHRGWAHGEPREVRLGPGEVETAYRLAVAEGFEPFAEGLRKVAAHALELQQAALPAWFSAFLDEVRRGAENADLSVLGMQRERFKREWRELLPALTAAAALAAGASGWERVVSERLFGDSKKLASVRQQVIAILLRADPRWEGIRAEEASDLLEVYGLRRKPGIIQCAGKALVPLAGREYRLEDFAPAAHLPEAWSTALVEGLAAAPPCWITTIENEYPFLAYIEEAGGPGGLGERGELVLYTGGFPSPATRGFLAAVARRAPEVRFRHWGDADLGGLRIWWLLRGELGRPVELFRTRAEWLEEEARRGAAALAPGERLDLERLQKQLAAAGAGAPDVAEALRLIDAILRLGVKLEQERY
jgi:hypothetical protein